METTKKSVPSIRLVCFLICAVILYLVACTCSASAGEADSFNDLAHSLSLYSMGSVKPCDTISNYPHNYMEILINNPNPPLYSYEHTSIIVCGNSRFAFYSSNDNGLIYLTSDSNGGKTFICVTDWSPSNCGGISNKWSTTANLQYSLNSICPAFLGRNIVGGSNNAMVFKDYATARTYCDTGVYSVDDLIYSNLPQDEYSADLGYLLGVQKYFKVLKQQKIPAGSKVPVTVNRQIHFGWDSSTSSGLDLIHHNYPVGVQAAISPHFEFTLSNGDVFKPDCNDKLVFLDNQFGILDYDLYENDLKDRFRDVYEEAKVLENEYGHWWSSYTVKLTWSFYFRPFIWSDSHYIFGDWIRISFHGDLDNYADEISSSEPSSTVQQVYIPDDGGVPSINYDSIYSDGLTFRPGVGSGSSFDEALHNSSQNPTIVLPKSDYTLPDNSLNFFILNLKGCFEILGQLPVMINTVLSYLPLDLLVLMSCFITVLFILRVTGR